MFRADACRSGSYEGKGPLACHRAAWRFDLRKPAGVPRTWCSTSTPAVLEGGELVLLEALDGQVYGLDGRKGAVRWSLPNPRPGHGASGGSPWAEGGVTWVAAADGVVEIDAAGGRELRRLPVEGGAEAAPTPFENLLLVGTGKQQLCALDRSSGAVAWARTFASGVGSAVAVAEGVAVFTTNDGTTLALDARGGRELWRRDLGKAGRSSFPVVDGVLYRPTGAGASLLALDLRDGQTRWEYNARALTFGEPAAADGLVAFTTMYGGRSGNGVWVLDAQTGELRWAFDHGFGGSLGVSFAGGVAYATLGDTLFARQAADGEPLWQYKAPNPFASPPAIAGGSLYVTTTHHLLALR